MKKRLTALILACLLLLSLAACAAASAASVDLMKDVKPNDVTADVDLTGSGATAATDFAVRLFRAGMTEGENSLISPMSVLYALAMTANGAVGEARTQMEAVLGMPVEGWNEYLHAWMERLPTDGERYKLSLANAIWFRDVESFTVNRDFLQTNADYYGAGIYKAPFDRETVKDINSWVSKHTDGMIEGIVDAIPEDTVMYLLNALAFDAEWAAIYKENQVGDGIFTTESGAEQQVEYMRSTLRQYLEDELATGFIKHYAGDRYAFVAMLPNEGISVAEYVEFLTGEGLQKLLAEPVSVEVRTSLPKFTTEFEADLSEILKAMGMEAPFEGGMTGIGISADLPDMRISKVVHKTFITVDEKGTRAGAVTAVSNAPTGAEPSKDYKEVYLDRPFVYLIVDCETNIPIFIGTVMSVN